MEVTPSQRRQPGTFGKNNMKSRKLLLSSAALLPVLGTAQTERPNIIILNIDDMGYSDPSCFGGDYVNTANIDQLASEGLSLKQFYTSCPISSPSRVGLTTGMLEPSSLKKMQQALEKVKR